MLELKGSIPALVTPFRDGSVDIEALERLVEWHIAEGSDGLVAVGTTGESPTVSKIELKDIIKELKGGRAQDREAAASAFAAQHPHGALDDPRVPVTGRYGILADQERGRDSELDPRSTAGRAEVEMGAMLLTQQI